MMIAYDEVQHQFDQCGSLPASDFDLLFFMENMAKFFGKADILRRILAGEELAAEYDF
jgi:hypothetical protein